VVVAGYISISEQLRENYDSLFCCVEKGVEGMRLGELRTVTRDMDNKLIVKVASYDTEKGVRIFDVAFDVSNDSEIYLRIINDE